MSQFASQLIKSFIANQSITAYTVVTRAATSTYSVAPWNTATAMVIGVAQNNGSTGDAIEVAIAGTSKVYCAASVSAGSIVGPNTATANLTGGIGSIVERVGSFTSTIAYKQIGVALEAGSTNSIIEVLIHVSNVSGV